MRITRTKLLDIVDQVLSVSCLGADEKRSLRETAEGTDHVLLNQWGDSTCGCIVGQTLDGVGTGGYGTFGRALDQELRIHLDEDPYVEPSTRIVLKVINR